MASQTISIIGGLDADLIIIASRIPKPGESVLANGYLESLGGKGANSAISTYRTCHKSPVSNNQLAGQHDSTKAIIRDNTTLLMPNSAERPPVSCEACCRCCKWRGYPNENDGRRR